MKNYNYSGLVNVGSVMIFLFSNWLIWLKKVRFSGEILTDTSKPDGTPRKLMDVSKLNNLGWKAKITLEEGIQKVYEEIKNNSWE